MIMKVLVLSFLGGMICMDRIVLQSMISRPIVTAPLIGLILGDAYTGLVVGALLELLWIDRLPIGAYVPPNDTVVALLVTTASILTGREVGYVSHDIVALSALLFIPFGILAQKMDRLIIRSNDRLAKEAEEAARHSDLDGISRKHLSALLKVFSFTTLFIFCSLIIGLQLMIYCYPHITPPLRQALTMTYYFLPVLGVAVALHTIKKKGALPLFCAAFLLAALFLELFNVL